MVNVLRLCAISLGIALGVSSLRAETRAQLAEAYRTAASVTYEVPAEVKLYDALTALTVTPDSSTDLLRAIDAAHKSETDAALIPSLTALEALYAAYRGEMTDYKKAVATLRKKTSDATLLQTVDVSTLLKTCGTCQGRLTCKTCKGALKCPTCKGKGTTTVREKNASDNFLAASSSKKVPCSTCRGVKYCPACKGEAKTCATCNSTGKHPDETKVAARIKTLAQSACAILQPTLAQELLTREQTLLLAEDLKRAEAMPEVEDALHVFTSLPEERFHARQWSQAERCRTLLETMKQATGVEAVELERRRTFLRNAILDAQRASDPLKGLSELRETILRYQDLDTVDEAKTAYDGLVLAYVKQQTLQLDHLVDRKQMILQLQRPQERIAQLEATLQEWETLAPQPLPKKLQPYNDLGPQGTFKASLVDELKRDFETLLAEARTAEEKAAEENGMPLWVWAGAAIGGLLLLSGLFSFLQHLRERRQEEARRARERAVRESIRGTFSHRRH